MTSESQEFEPGSHDRGSDSRTNVVNRNKILTATLLTILLLAPFALLGGSWVIRHADSLKENRLFSRLVKGDDPEPTTRFTRYVRLIQGGILVGTILGGWTAWQLVRLRPSGSGEGRSPEDLIASHPLATYLVVTGIYLVAAGIGPQQDYYAFVKMWEIVLNGDDPWTNSTPGGSNYYGPAFNALALLSWLNPLWPKLLICWVYIRSAAWLVRRFPRREEGAGRRDRQLVALALVICPYFLIEIPVSGHFDVLIAACCLAALSYRQSRRDVIAGALMGLGFLVKFYPLALVPFLSLDGRRVRFRILLAFAATAAVGMLLGLAIWGPTTFRPLLSVSGRGTTRMSLFAFLERSYSPLRLVVTKASFTTIGSKITAAALGVALVYAFVKRVSPLTAVLIASLVLVTFSNYGLPQYYTIPALVLIYWMAENRRIETTCVAYFVYLSVYNVFHFLDWMGNYPNHGVLFHTREVVGLPTFLMSCSVLWLVVSSTRTGGQGGLSEPATS